MGEANGGKQSQDGAQVPLKNTLQKKDSFMNGSCLGVQFGFVMPVWVKSGHKSTIMPFAFC